MAIDKIIIKGARENNLKNIDLVLPKNKLIVFTGLSGSGKSSLAFNTIYAEGRRRYVESLSAYARQFLGGNEKPDVDSIEGLSPAIAIDQKTATHNPRSTVGTVTEIYDYLRLLYARIGNPYCINGHGLIKPVSFKEIANWIEQSTTAGEAVYVMAPLVRHKKGSFKDLFGKLNREGFIRVQVDGKIYLLSDPIELDKNQRHDIDIVVDRIVYMPNPEIRSRLLQAAEVAVKYSAGLIKIHYPQSEHKKDVIFSTSLSCPVCGFTIPSLEPRLFSFNAPLGACPDCNGLGVKLEADPDLIIPDPELSIRQGGIPYFKNIVDTDNLEWQRFRTLCDYYYIDLSLPISQLTEKQRYVILWGSDEPIATKLISAKGRKHEAYDFIEGVAALINRRFFETQSDEARRYYSKYMAARVCPICKGSRLNPTALAVKINHKSIADFTKMPIDQALNFILNLKLTPNEQQIANLVLKELIARLNFLNEVGLGYLDLARQASTLSGGESQRIRLAKQMGAQLSGILYVLDEPSIGLHQRDNDKLLATLQQLKALGNTLIVVEHDEDTMKVADWIVDIGPGAGIHGGKVIFNGTYKNILKNEHSLTGQYLAKKLRIPLPKKRRGGNGQTIEFIRASENNLRNINVTLPLNKFITITGVSGSGKSTLLEEIIYKGLQKNLTKEIIIPGKYRQIKGAENIDKVVYISQDPIGKTPRSNPGTYTGVFDDIRNLFAMTKEAKIRGYTKSRFSFNVPGGRCENCKGDGVITISMQFMPSVEVTCEVCDGKRYNEETLQVKYRQKSIADVLAMTIDEAYRFFDKVPQIKDKLKAMIDVGLGYLHLGESSTTLSGGEAQRVKLSTYLLKKATGKTLFLLDEPTTGLHIDDVKRLINVLNQLVDRGNTVVVIEHNLDFIKVSDYIIDLGPEGGAGGGRVVATGTPEQVVKIASSYTGQYLRKYLND